MLQHPHYQYLRIATDEYEDEGSKGNPLITGEGSPIVIGSKDTNKRSPIGVYLAVIYANKLRDPRFYRA
jgi:hypothetical protein